jgi:hypothetical protein
VEQKITLVEGSARRVLGMVNGALNHWEAAERLLTESVSLAEQQGVRYEAAQALVQLALLYRRRAAALGSDEDQAAGIETGDRAVAIFEELGAQWDLAQARQLLAG